MPRIIPIIFLLLFACTRERTQTKNGKPVPPTTPYFNEKYLLRLLPDDYYLYNKPGNSFTSADNSPSISFKPFGVDDKLHLSYTHIYSPKCVYHTSDDVWKYAETCFPNTCLTKDKAYADATIRNLSSSSKRYYLRLFYQNTSYWYRTDDSLSFSNQNYLDNYYGASETILVEMPAQDSVSIKIPYTIGMNPKGEFDFDPSRDPARPGNYEFLLLLEESNTGLISEQLDLKKVNPFAEVKKRALRNEKLQFAYTPAEHFKFIFLDEYFDGTNDLTPNHIYIPKHGKEKKLCDTCSGWFRAVLNENWSHQDFFEGFVSKSPFVKANYGIRRDNFAIDSNGVTLHIPRSLRGYYQKTWSEFLFGPSFKYGHLTVRAKFSQMMNKSGTPNGVIHNLWLYQRNPDEVDTTNPYHHHRNMNGVQPFEIDFEFWSSNSYKENTLWNADALINYSIVDYMRDANVALKPGENKQIGKYELERFNAVQASVIGEEFRRDFFNSFHTYELFWHPDHVRFLVDGVEQAVITSEAAKIPDKYLFLWIGSPIYQDGTYYSQSNIPFLKYDKQTVIDYIRIE